MKGILRFNPCFFNHNVEYLEISLIRFQFVLCSFVFSARFLPLIIYLGNDDIIILTAAYEGQIVHCVFKMNENVQVFQ